jgi:hypothetical protein
MTTLERLAAWKRDGVITDLQYDTLGALVRKDHFPVWLELNALLYLGVLSIAAGVVWTIQTHLADLGNAAILVALTTTVGACVWYCFSRGAPYSAGAVESPTLAFDYVLYLACVLFAIELGFIEARFTLLRDAWDTYVLLSAVVFFAAAYRFDNTFVLSLALSTLAAWFGIKLTHLGLRSTEPLRVSAILYGALVAAIGGALRRLNIKLHFVDTHLHLAATAVFLALLSGVLENRTGLFYLALLVALGGASVFHGIRRHRFAFVTYGLVFPYLGLSARLLRGLFTESRATMAFGYVVVSGGAMVVVIVYIARRFGREE